MFIRDCIQIDNLFKGKSKFIDLFIMNILYRTGNVKHLREQCPLLGYSVAYDHLNLRIVYYNLIW